MKSLLVVPAQVSEKLLAALSTALRSFTPRDDNSPRAFCVSKVEVTIPVQADTIPTPAAAITLPAF